MNLILADRTLESYMGHSFEYARSVGEHARDLGHTVTTLGARRVAPEVAAEVGAIPCFRYHNSYRFELADVVSFLLPRDIRTWLGDEWNYARHARALAEDLAAVQDRLPLDRDALVLFPTVSYNDIAPIVTWANHFRPGQCPWIALVLHFSAYPDYALGSPMPHYYARACARLLKSPHRDRFRLFTDSAALAEEYRDYIPLPVAVLPIPHAHPAGPAPCPARRAAGTLRLTYLGDARVHKGFHLLPPLFKRLAPDLAAGLVEAEIQANVRSAEEWPAVLAVERLRNQPGVTLHETELTTGQYYALLGRADVVLLPYTLEYYHAQTSGIFAEALAHGKPVIVPRGTWMAGELKRHGAGVTFLPGDPLSLYHACQEAARDFDDLQAVAAEGAASWRRRHSTAAYLDLLLNSLAEGN
jgi:glycosyltransferase involved in cell wall biosynthesis